MVWGSELLLALQQGRACCTRGEDSRVRSAYTLSNPPSEQTYTHRHLFNINLFSVWRAADARLRAGHGDVVRTGRWEEDDRQAEGETEG